MRLAERGRHLEALNVALSAVAVDPLRKSAHRIVMRIHLTEGNCSQAMRQFNIYAQIIRRIWALNPPRRLNSCSTWPGQAYRGLAVSLSVGQ